MALCRRSELYQLTHFSVSRSTWLTDFQGTRKLMTSVLNRPIMLSASPLSSESPTLPTEASILKPNRAKGNASTPSPGRTARATARPLAKLSETSSNRNATAFRGCSAYSRNTTMILGPLNMGQKLTKIAMCNGRTSARRPKNQPRLITSRPRLAKHLARYPGSAPSAPAALPVRTRSAMPTQMTENRNNANAL